MNRNNSTLPISVIVPVRNRARLLAETLDSIGAQTAAPAEVIVIDDGSTDDSAAVAERAGAVVIRTPGYGVSVARNTGIERSRQRWVALCDSDDLWEPEKLERQWAALQASPRAGFCFTDVRTFGEGPVPDDRLATGPAYPTLPKRALAGVEDGYGFDDAEFVRAICRHNFCAASSWLLRRDYANATGFDATMRYAEDYDFLLRLLSRTSAVVVDRPLLRYRVHATGASRNNVDMSLSVLSIVERAARRPDRYPAGIARFLESHVWRMHRRIAMDYLRAGDFGRARNHLRSSLRHRLEPRTLVALAALSVAPARTAAYAARSR